MKLTDLMAHTKKSARFPSRKHEKRVAEDFGGKVVAGSGSSMFAKGDVRAPDFLFEAKHRAKISAEMTKVAQKATAEALAIGRVPIIDLECDIVRTEPRWVMIPASAFRSMLEALGKIETK